MRARLDRAVGLAVIFVALALGWYAAGFLPALLLFAWLIVVRQLLLYLLLKDSKAAKTTAVLLMPTLVFLLFLPKSIRNRLEEMRKREKSGS